MGICTDAHAGEYVSELNAAGEQAIIHAVGSVIDVHAVNHSIIIDAVVRWIILVVPVAAYDLGDQITDIIEMRCVTAVQCDAIA